MPEQKEELQKQQGSPTGPDKLELSAFRPQVVLKFQDYVRLPYEDGVEHYFEENQVGPWDRLAEEFPGITLKPLFTSQNPEEIQALVERAMELDSTYEPPNLMTYFIVEYPRDVDPDALAKVLSSWDTVQTAYVDRPGPDPQVNATDDPLWISQVYLDPAPDGIDAEYAWGFTGGDGAGLGFVDLERGWTLNHEDLNAHGASLLHGTLLNSSRNHGTAVLGEVCAVDNTVGCVGIVPNLTSVNVVSYHGSSRPNAIMAAITALSFGDVLLLEAQVWIPHPLLGPIECYDADFDAIRLATALGIVVVEAGGNGTNNGSAPALNLDTYTNPAGLQILNRDPANPDFRDSGAIIVTAATSTSPHTRLAYGPHGNRIDCYAWGQNIDTCASNLAGAINLYRTDFGGTSGASPIITGAALVIQGIADNPISGLGYRFSPRQLRAILSDPATGTPPAATETTHIGVMPNLRNIIDNVLQTAPDVYIRDFVGDTGDPHTGSISSSPDIILLPTLVASPQTSFGAGSGTENSNTLGSEATPGQPNYIYVRVLNRGGTTATNVNATVYWAPVSTLLTPDLWTKVPLAGPPPSVTIPSVPAGDVLTVSSGITWPSGEIPASGHYCFVGLIGTEDDPAPDPADFLNWDNYRRFIRENNNVTWRNFNVVNNAPSPEAGDPEDYVALPFLAPGAPDKARLMRLEVVAKLPEGARVFLELPQYLIDAIQERSPFVKFDEKNGDVAWLPVNPHGRKMLGEAVFPAKSRMKLRLLVHIPKEYRENEYDVFVRQLYEEEEVGRVTWRLVPTDRKEWLAEKQQIKK
jgi:hypothetical protein